METRKKFEALPRIVERVGALEFNDYTKEYESSLMCCSNEAYVNGAWMAFQEQQKKIDKAIEEATAWHTLTGNALGLKIKELLK